MSNVYQHFRDEEAPFIDTMIDDVRRVLENYMPALTNFLNPRERLILDAIAGQYAEIQLDLSGVFPDAERQRAILYPEYDQIALEDFEISLVEIDYPRQFTQLTHGSILGTLMGAGITREKLGDIISDGNRWQFAADRTIATYLIQEVSQIGKHSVILKEVPISEMIQSEESWEEQTVIVSSMRLDAVISRILNLSRNNAKALIQNGKVKVNFGQVDRPDYECELADLISVRGFGRARLISTEGITKKDNIVLKIQMIKSS